MRVIELAMMIRNIGVIISSSSSKDLVNWWLLLLFCVSYVILNWSENCSETYLGCRGDMSFPRSSIDCIALLWGSRRFLSGILKKPLPSSI